MPLDAFIAGLMTELELDTDEIAVADAKRLTSAACASNVRKVFDLMN